jgi:hypothetical protein
MLERIQNMISISVLALSLSTAACGSSSNGSDASTSADGGTADGAVNSCATKYNGGGTNCAMNPMTHLELINACTDPSVTKIEKHPVLPMLNADCSLPPIQ